MLQGELFGLPQRVPGGKARQLVLDPRLSLKDVSTACGYADANYFTRVFKRITGKTPSEYRLENLNN